MNMPHTMRLERGHFGKDDEGGAEPKQWETIANNHACWVQPDNASEAIEFHRLNGFIPYKVYTADNVDARVQDRVVVLDGSFAGKTLNVLGQRDMGGAGRYFRIECEERPVGQHLQDAG